MAKAGEKIYMPAGIGGLTRYSEDVEEVVKLKPKQLVWIVIFIVIFELLLKAFF